jgi:sucrose-6-phosphate hydrolase SacC (GH32 family)
VNFDNNFGRHIHAAPLQLEYSTLQLHIFIDRSSIEVFGNGGIVVITDLIFPNEKINEAAFYTLNGNAKILKLDAWELESIYNDKVFRFFELPGSLPNPIPPLPP